MERYLSRELEREPGEEVLVASFPCAEHHQRTVAAAQELRQYRDDQVDALLADQPADHADQRYAVGNRDADACAERASYGGFSRQIVGAEAYRQVAVRAGVPLLVVDAVEDADDALAARAQEAVQARAVLRRADLARIAGAYRCYEVRIKDAMQQRVDPPLGQVLLVQQPGGVIEA
ncbi:MAG: hypothetical protein NTZ79_10780 [Proteobacteria bacterium]|nr:hypothetical protein [Pseudomonadota bacterium]